MCRKPLLLFFILSLFSIALSAQESRFLKALRTVLPEKDNPAWMDSSSPDDIDESYLHKYDNPKGQFRLKLEFPYINSFHFLPMNEGVKNNTGFMGFNCGLDYFYKENRYINVSYSFLQDFFLPIAFTDRGDEYELMSSPFISISNNHQYRKFAFGYGLGFAKNSWEVRNDSWNEESSARKPIRKTNNVLGFTFSSHYRIRSVFSVGVIYRPTVFRMNRGGAFQYEHSISLNFGINVPFGKNWYESASQ